MKINTKHFMIFSLGQLTKSNIKPSISAFAKLLSGNNWISSIIYPFAYCYVSSIYCIDYAIIGKIKRFNSGDFNSNDFRKYLRRFIWTGSDYEIDGAWNKLCQIDGQSIGNIKTLCDFLEKEFQARVLIVSSTNEINAQYCHETISKKIEKFDALIDSRKIIYAYSFNKKTTSLQALAELGIKDATAEDESKIKTETELENKSVNYTVTPFHRNITFKGSENIRFNPDVDTMSDALSKFKEILGHVDVLSSPADKSRNDRGSFPNVNKP